DSLGTAPAAVPLLVDEVPEPSPHQTVGPVPALRPERTSLHVAGLPSARRVPCVKVKARPPAGRARVHSRLRAVAPFALCVGTQRPQEVDAAEVRPVGLTEVELAMGALPEQETTEPLLPRGADHQIGIGLTLGVEMVGDVLDVE